jgi:hypothetical protein
MFNPDKVSKTELQFIRAYVAAMRRDYYMLWSVLDLMNPAFLGVKEIVVAAKTARALQAMQADFDQELLALQEKHKLRRRGGDNEPTVDQLSELFTLSFFKVITTSPKGKKKDDGWFSGEPTAWPAMLKSMQGIDNNKLPDMLGAYLSAVMKLFGPSGMDNLFPLADTPINNYWNLPKNSFKFNKADDFNDEYYDEEEDDDFTTFFSDDD